MKNYETAIWFWHPERLLPWHDMGMRGRGLSTRLPADYEAQERLLPWHERPWPLYEAASWVQGPGEAVTWAWEAMASLRGCKLILMPKTGCYLGTRARCDLSRRLPTYSKAKKRLLPRHERPWPLYEAASWFRGPGETELESGALAEHLKLPGYRLEKKQNSYLLKNTDFY